MPKTVKVHVTFNDSKLILSHQRGEEVKDLRHLFLQVFSDVLSDQVSPADVKLQRYDSSFDDYVDLTSDEKLEDDIKIRALVSKHDKQSSKMPKTVQVHVTFNDSKRILSHQKGKEVKDLRHLFLQVFSDVLLDQVAPADVKLQRYDSSFDDYVDLTSHERLEDDIKVLALTTSPSAGEEETSSKHPHCGQHWVFPWIHIHGACEYIFPAIPIFPAHRTGPIKPHPVTPNTNYRLWSLVSRQNDGLLQRNSSNNNVTADGSFSSSRNNTVITTSAISQYDVSLIFKNGNKEYVITAKKDQSGNITIKAVETSSGPYPDNATFTYDYFWSYTVFKNNKFNTQYLGCDSSGNTLLVDMNSLQYPNPQALFILNTV